MCIDIHRHSHGPHRGVLRVDHFEAGSLTVDPQDSMSPGFCNEDGIVGVHVDSKWPDQSAGNDASLLYISEKKLPGIGCSGHEPVARGPCHAAGSVEFHVGHQGCVDRSCRQGTAEQGDHEGQDGAGTSNHEISCSTTNGRRWAQVLISGTVFQLPLRISLEFAPIQSSSTEA